MSDTPRTDAIIDDDDTLGHKLARFVVLSTTLERELAAALADAQRLEWIMDEPEAARHLLNLLMHGKGTRDDFTKMIDRISKSKNAMREEKS
jgi:hypothetical protein